MVFLALVEAVAATRLARTDRLAQAERLDRASSLVFPGLLVVILLFAFAA